MFGLSAAKARIILDLSHIIIPRNWAEQKERFGYLDCCQHVDGLIVLESLVSDGFIYFCSSRAATQMAVAVLTCQGIVLRYSNG